MALKMPPGASHFQTSPNPPAPIRSMSRYPRIGSASAFFSTGMTRPLGKRRQGINAATRVGHKFTFVHHIARGQHSSRAQTHTDSSRADTHPTSVSRDEYSLTTDMEIGARPWQDGRMKLWSVYSCVRHPLSTNCDQVSNSSCAAAN